MNEPRDFLRRLVDLLDEAGIPYMVAGSLGSSLHGRPRATNDVDLVIDPTESQFRQFLESLGTDYYVSQEAAWAALKARSAFNVIDDKTGWKADLRVRAARAFSTVEFGRRQKAIILGLEVWVLSPEDAILSKLEWAKESASEQQMRDVLGVLQIQGRELDEQYLWKWAKSLGVQDTLTRLLKESREGME
jgi:hypothetical protein